MENNFECVTIYNNKVYNGHLLQGKINGVKLEDFTPIDNPGPVFTTNNYGLDMSVFVNGEYKIIDKTPKGFHGGDGKYMLSDAQYIDLIDCQTKEETEEQARHRE